MKEPQRWRVVGVVVALAIAQLLAILVYRGVQSRRRASTQPVFRYERLTNDRAPDVDLVAPDGSKPSLAAFRGEVVLLHFWATWCLPCQEELPGLLALGRELGKSHRVRVVAVSTDADWPKVREFFRGDIPAEVVRDASASAKSYGVFTLPDTYLIGADGLLRLRFRGARDWRLQPAREAVLEEIAR